MRHTLRTLLAVAIPVAVHAQWTAAPPTYDYVADHPALPETLGVQPPISTRPGGPLEGFEQRIMRDHVVQVSLQVSLDDLQAAMPAGFVAVASGVGTATLFAGLTLGQTSWNAGLGSLPHYSYVYFVAQARNQAQGRVELVLLAIETSSAAAVERQNATFGAGVARLAEVEEEVEVEGTATRYKVRVKDEALGLDVRMGATCPLPIDQRSVSDPDLRVFRFTSGTEAGGGFIQASQGLFRQIAQVDAKVRFEAKDGIVALPGGAVRVLGLAGTPVAFYRGFEAFRKKVP